MGEYFPFYCTTGTIKTNSSQHRGINKTKSSDEKKMVINMNQPEKYGLY